MECKHLIYMFSRSPHGECGLKLKAIEIQRNGGKSLPTRGVWIEINGIDTVNGWVKSLPTRGVWIEIKRQQRQE